ncbi:helix-turn-helix domain-containing protein [Halapricum hydrolyticum]|uniref:Helix-turn-helix domain-containing protein n=1 Tax=Halapricum hydrolyticum TaxID=2979991 RepID=A0AAE3IAM2_9EURY|nr:helix-turn-helix domain-containing protein [Halapricum hydrolyticum]MCU4717428.1 helix-turn-helix domain-containing protein [Halapricum hydrolyticum]MCU4726592.1 helix-turn-helix domain-containing protein [Halapricum hydrolyticum]
MTDSNYPLFVTLKVEDRSVLRHVVREYSQLESSVKMISIVDPSREDVNCLSIDVSDVTEKQWEALEVAHELGHYSTQRGGNLADIADALGISKSAASQRLRAAEGKIMSAILGATQIQETETV